MFDKQKLIADILKSDEKLQDFISFWARQYKYAFNSILELYDANPTGTYFTEMRQWNQAGRYIRKGSKSIHLHLPDGKQRCVFDLSQTHGKEIEIWSLPHEIMEQAFSFVCESAVLPEDYNEQKILIITYRKERGQNYEQRKIPHGVRKS